MCGSIRDDLFKDLLEWEDKSDLTISIGTSMCGLNSDRIFTTTARKSRRGLTIGGVIIGLQRTQYDHLSCLRIFAKIDDVMQMVLNELGLYLEKFEQFQLSKQALACKIESHQFKLPYDSNGILLTAVNTMETKIRTHNQTNVRKRETSANRELQTDQASSQSIPPLLLDLTPGAVVQITCGPYAGDKGEILGCTSDGHYRIMFRHVLSDSRGKKRETFSVRLLGLWWIEAAAKGSVPSIPIVNYRDKGI